MISVLEIVLGRFEVESDMIRVVLRMVVARRGKVTCEDSGIRFDGAVIFGSDLSCLWRNIAGERSPPEGLM